MDRRRVGILAVVIVLIIVIININNPSEALEHETHGSPEHPPVEPEPKTPEETPIQTGWRDFYLGFTPFPYDITQEAVKNTYKLLDEHSDIITHHFDSGVPWVAASSGEPYHDKVVWDLHQRASYLTDESVVYLALTPLNGDRTDMAGNWDAEGNMPLPEDWVDLRFNDSKVIDAYLNYCEDMIDRFDPDYLAYGIEVNMLAMTNPDAYEYFVSFVKQVYPLLKENHPNLPTFLSIQTEYYLNNPRQVEAVDRLLPYTDYIALSSYPFTSKPDPSEIPEDYYTQVADIAPEKPFCFAETGFPSGPTSIPEVGIELPGSTEDQTKFVEYLFETCETLDAEFITWFVLADYDATWNYLGDLGMNPIYKLWIETGLIDEELQEKQAMDTWDDWLLKTRVMD